MKGLINFLKQLWSPKQEIRCRMCERTDQPMAIGYGEADGLCRNCLLNLVKIPGVLGKEG